jgi:hypothetical protein
VESKTIAMRFRNLRNSKTVSLNDHSTSNSAISSIKMKNHLNGKMAFSPNK